MKISYLERFVAGLKGWNHRRILNRRRTDIAPNYAAWLRAVEQPFEEEVHVASSLAVLLFMNSVGDLSKERLEALSQPILKNGWGKVAFLLVQRSGDVWMVAPSSNGPWQSFESKINEFEWVWLVRDGWWPAKYGLPWLADAVLKNLDADFFYGDTDLRIDSEERQQPYFKPGPGFFWQVCSGYMSDGFLIRSILLSQCFDREGVEAISAFYGTVLNVWQFTGGARVRHVPRIILHQSSPELTRLNLACLDKADMALCRKGGAGKGYFYGAKDKIFFRCLDAQVRPTVSIIIPTRDRLNLLRNCIESICEKTDYPTYELIVVDNDSVELETLTYFEVIASLGRANVVQVPGEFNFSKLNNVAALQAKGELLLLLNNDIEVNSSDWLDRMVDVACMAGVGCVGPKLLYPNGTIQHGGLVTGIGGVAAHIFRGRSNVDSIYEDWLNTTHEVSSLTGACLLIKKNIYMQLGGLDERHLKVSFNDVDFCLRVQEAGFVNVYLGEVELVHHESVSRGVDSSASNSIRWRSEAAYMQRRWSQTLTHDKYRHPYFSLNSDQFELSVRPN